MYKRIHWTFSRFCFGFFFCPKSWNMLRCGHRFFHYHFFLFLPHSHGCFEIYAIHSTICSTAASMCVWWYGRISFQSLFYHIFFQQQPVMFHKKHFVVLFHFSGIHDAFCYCVVAPSFSPASNEHPQKNCAQIKTRRPVTGYCICNFKLIYRLLSYPSCNWLHIGVAFNFPWWNENHPSCEVSIAGLQTSITLKCTRANFFLFKFLFKVYIKSVTLWTMAIYYPLKWCNTTFFFWQTFNINT